MSETTPRPDEPADDTTTPPPPPADPTAEPSEEATSHEATPPPPPPPAEPPTEPAAPSEEAASHEATPPPPPPPAGEPPREVPQQPQVAPQQPPPAYPQPSGQATMTPQDERTWSMATHGITLGALLLSGGTLGFVAALVMYVLYKDRGPYIRANTANALNIQIMTIIGVVISFVLMFVLIGFVTIFLVGIYAVVLHIIGIVKASNGEWWEPPLTPKFVR